MNKLCTILLGFTLMTVISSMEAHAATTSNLEMSLKITSKNMINLYDAKGQAKQTIPKGTKVTLKAVTEQYGQIVYQGTTAYVNLVDFYADSIIDGSKKISFNDMQLKLQAFSKMYPGFTDSQIIGQSVEGRPLYALKVGTGSKQILMDASFHAREYMTTNVLMKMIEAYVHAYANQTTFGKYDVKSILANVSIVFVPMVNPDGVTLAQGGQVNTSLATLKKYNNGSANFDRWKANVHGVDLNRQFAVNWHLIKTTKPSFKEYKGTKPFTEPEALAMKKLIDQTPFKAYISYHSSGQIIYWSRAKTMFERTKLLVRDISTITGYKLMPVTKSNEPIAAAEDYFTKVKDMPAMTIEIAPYAGEVSVPLSQWADVWKRNQFVGLYLANEARKW